MGFWDTITDLVDAATPWSVAEAEAPAADDKAEDSKVRAAFLEGALLLELVQLGALATTSRAAD